MQREQKNISGHKIKQARIAMKPALTQDELSGRVAAHGVHLDRSAIAKIEAGIRSVNDYELLALAMALDVDIAWLLGAK
jgi:transcriptional regulator with XRE-family HTH domain